MLKSKFTESSKLALSEEHEFTLIKFDQNIKNQLHHRQIDFLIAGGFYRDLLLGLVPSDIDIYITRAVDQPESLFSGLTEMSTLSPYKKGEHIDRHFKTEMIVQGQQRAYPINVDLMVLKMKPSSNEFRTYPMWSFTVEISKIWYGSFSKSMKMSTLFKSDLKNGTLSYIDTPDSYYTNKIMTYFPMCTPYPLNCNNQSWEHMNV